MGDVAGQGVDERQVVPVRASQIRGGRKEGGGSEGGFLGGSYGESDTASHCVRCLGPSRKRRCKVSSRSTARGRHTEIRKLRLDIGRAGNELAERRLDPETAEGDGLGPYVGQPPEQGRGFINDGNNGCRVRSGRHHRGGTARIHNISGHLTDHDGGERSHRYPGSDPASRPVRHLEPAMAAESTEHDEVKLVPEDGSGPARSPGLRAWSDPVTQRISLRRPRRRR